MIRAHLVDASPYIFRAFFSLPKSITDPGGRPINAVHGFAGFLLRLLAEERPSHLAVAFDGSLTTSFRNDIYSEYKAHREPPAPELEAQLDDCRELAAALGAATFVDASFEADDLIGSLVRRLEAAGHGAVVVTSDKDLAQLVSERTELLDFARGERYGPREVSSRFGVRPDQVADLLALAGDPVDNIPGIPGVGPKTAAALLAHFDSVEDLYGRLDEVASLPLRGAAGLQSRLEAGRESADLSLRLSQIALDVPLRGELADLAYVGADRRLLEKCAERLGMTSLMARIPRWAGSY